MKAKFLNLACYELQNEYKHDYIRTYLIFAPRTMRLLSLKDYVKTMQGITEKIRKKEMINFSDSELNLHKSRRSYFRKLRLAVSRLSTECVMTRLKLFKKISILSTTGNYDKRIFKIENMDERKNSN
ncbi:Protein CBG13362 [Caenorhabditis briggsae]|uniref:Protein CBG13362 n=1 Tax=Caenorhabditis briggsae TaxID=6238 RepID=A8XHY2_CAEBR|nr:Protein CBG13362 [Caenorhabditis briggsae]CAP32248.1 Protein CBG13362 [Caenorhabditis briggsae]